MNQEFLIEKIKRFNNALDTLNGYKSGTHELPTSLWTREEIIDMQYNRVCDIRDEVVSSAMGWTRANCLAKDIEEEIVKIKNFS